MPIPPHPGQSCELQCTLSRCCKELGSIDLLVNVSHHARGRSEEVWDDIVHAQNINFLPFCLSMHLESSLAKGSIVINVGATIQDQKDLLRQAYFDFLHFSLQTLTNTLAKKLSGVAQVYSIEHGSYSSCVSERGYTRKKLEAQAKESSDAAVVRIVRWLTEVPNHLATGLTIFLEDTHL